MLEGSIVRFGAGAGAAAVAGRAEAGLTAADGLAAGLEPGLGAARTNAAVPADTGDRRLPGGEAAPDAEGERSGALGAAAPLLPALAPAPAADDCLVYTIELIACYRQTSVQSFC